jgi:hypothetical protein
LQGQELPEHRRQLLRRSDRHLPGLRRIAEHGNALSRNHDRGRNPQRRQELPELHYILVECFEVDLVGGQRLDDKSFRPVKERLGVGNRRNHADILWEFGDKRQGNTPDAVHARRHQAEDRRGSTCARSAHESPRGAREVNIQPSIAKRRTTGGQALTQPVVPGIRERIGNAPTQEVAVARELAVQPYFHVRSPDASRLMPFAMTLRT